MVHWQLLTWPKQGQGLGRLGIYGSTGSIAGSQSVKMLSKETIEGLLGLGGPTARHHQYHHVRSADPAMIMMVAQPTTDARHNRAPPH